MSESIEKFIIGYLSREVCPAYGEVPPDPPDEFIVVEKTGSGPVEGSAGVIPSGTVALQSYAPTLAAAADLNERVKTAMAAIVATSTVTSAVLNGDYPYTDTATKRRRYQAVYDLVYYS